MFKNKKFGLLLVVVLLIVPVVLAACGDDDDKDGGDSKTELTQSFEAAGISVKYPDGWLARESESGGVEIANSQDAFDAMDAGEGGGPAEGQAAVAIFGGPLSDMGDMGAKEAFEMMAGFMASEEDGTTASDVSDVKIGGKDGYRVNITDESSNSEGFLVGFEVDGNLIIGAGVAAKGELGDFEDTLMAIISGVEYSAPAAE